MGVGLSTCWHTSSYPTQNKYSTYDIWNLILGVWRTNPFCQNVRWWEEAIALLSWCARSRSRQEPSGDWSYIWKEFTNPQGCQEDNFRCQGKIVCTQNTKPLHWRGELNKHSCSWKKSFQHQLIFDGYSFIIMASIWLYILHRYFYLASNIYYCTMLNF